jgi:hypothetical protein
MDAHAATSSRAGVVRGRLRRLIRAKGLESRSKVCMDNASLASNENAGEKEPAGPHWWRYAEELHPPIVKSVGLSLSYIADTPVQLSSTHDAPVDETLSPGEAYRSLIFP